VLVQELVEELVTATPAQTLGDLPYAANGDATGTIRFWNCWGGSRIRLMNSMIEGFHNLYPGINVQSVLYQCSDLTQLYLTAIAAGDPPEVTMQFSSDIPKFVASDALLPLDELAEADGVDLSRYYPAEVTSRQYQGQTYLLPQVSALAKTMLYTNKNVMADAGVDVAVTWEDMIEISKEVVTVDGGQVTRSAFWPMFHPQLLDGVFPTWLGLNNGQVINDSLDQMTFNSDEGLEALQFMLEVSDINVNNAPEDYLTTGETEYQNLMRQLFVEDKHMTYMHGSWMFNIFNSMGKGLDDYTVSAVPYNAANPDAVPGTSVEGGWGFGIPKGVADPAASWEWVKYTCYGPASGEFTKAQVRPNPIQEYNEHPDLLLNPHWETMLGLMAEERAYPVTEAWPRQREIIRDMSWSVLYHQETPEEALQRAYEECQAELEAIL
jgi:ABC-type glycerol-3-phosphate transport system substrate-binding protein